MTGKGLSWCAYFPNDRAQAMTIVERLRAADADPNTVTSWRDLVMEAAAEIERLEAEVAKWKERWAAERRDHETTIRHFDELMNEVT